MISRGEVWWVDLPRPLGSEPGLRHPMVVVQSDTFTHAGLRTTVCVLVTSNLRLADAPGNVFLARGESSLPRPSVANVSQILTLDQGRLRERVGRLPPGILFQILRGIGLVLGVDYVLSRG